MPLFGTPDVSDAHRREGLTRGDAKHEYGSNDTDRRGAV
jgi:hypothetical protein